MLSHVLKAQSWRRHKSCPAVYINGDAYAVGTINPGRQGYQRLPDAASIISEQMKAVRPGQKYARKFIALPKDSIMLSGFVTVQPKFDRALGSFAMDLLIRRGSGL
jgi:hypothetical protein